ncbi:MAG TPA: YbaY family lipoprotein [Phototrophicaceae bacterium]|jgi:uncharacterized lipoprotein YbaY|nr:YbaY family lipoprotein [Phototrophicaceae bacterium]
MGTKTKVTGEILLDDSAPAFSGATVYVRLEDTSLMDATAPVLAEQVLHRVSHAEGQPISFNLEGERPVNEQSRLNVSVHISLHNSGEIRPGDYITVQSYPVLTHGNPDHVQVQVRRV